MSKKMLIILPTAVLSLFLCISPSFRYFFCSFPCSFIQHLPAVVRIRSFCLALKYDEQWKCNCSISLFSLLLLLLMLLLLLLLLLQLFGAVLLLLRLLFAFWSTTGLPSLMTLMSFIFISSCCCLFALLAWFAVDDVHHTLKVLRLSYFSRVSVFISLSHWVFRQAQKTFLCGCHAAVDSASALSTLLLLCHNFFVVKYASASSVPSFTFPFRFKLVKDSRELGSKLRVGPKNFRRLTTLAIDSTWEGSHSAFAVMSRRFALTVKLDGLSELSMN